MQNIVFEYIKDKEEQVVSKIHSIPSFSPLVAFPLSRIITDILLVVFVVLLAYESIYWSGIYLGLWDYHAKEIFKEIPIHCAHVYVRLGILKKEKLGKLDEYYDLKRDSVLSVLSWKNSESLAQEIFEFKKFVKYHFEFSPEDFEMNKEPEYGSTILNLRERVLELFTSSDIYSDYHDKNYSPHDVLIFDKKAQKVGYERDNFYLVKCNIETGNCVDAIIVY